jgi:flagellar hook-associated protein 1 FlgK
MADMFQIGLSGLTTTQARLNTTSHNIANVNTEGFSKQISTQNTRDPERAGGAFIGTGAVLSGVERAFDNFKYREMLVNTTRHSYNEVLFSNSQRLDQVLSDEDTAITNSLFAFFEGVNGVADSPNSLEARNVMIENAKNMTSTFNRMYDELVFQQNAINDEINNIANEITALSKNLAETNVNILTASAGDVVPPNDLYDQRDEIVRRIAELTNVSTVIGSDGQANLYIGTGSALVVGGESNTISAIPGNPDTGQLDLAVELPNATIRMDSTGLGGKMQALFEYRNDVLNPAFSRLGLTAVAIADTVNQQQREGTDLNGQIGTDFFNDVNTIKSMRDRVLSNQDGLGTATLSVRIEDVTQLKPVEYTLTVQSYAVGPPETATFVLEDLTNGTTQTVTFPDLAASERLDIPSEGFSIAIDSISVIDPLQAGKTFRIRPTHLAANEMTTAQSLPDKIAAAASDVVLDKTVNTGNFDVEMVSIDDRTDPLFPTSEQSFDLVFTNVAGGVYEYEIRDSVTGNIITIPDNGNSYNLLDNTGAAVTYGPGVVGTTGDENQLGGAVDSLGYAPDIKEHEATISVLGFTIKIEGFPAVGDTINISHDDTGVGDNRNAVLMADLQDAKLLNGNKSTFQDNYSLLITEVGSVAAAAEIRYDAGEVLLTQAVERLDSVRGVNIDEEATDLMRYQQTYAANARVLTIAKELFDTVISSIT